MGRHRWREPEPGASPKAPAADLHRLHALNPAQERGFRDGRPTTSTADTIAPARPFLPLPSSRHAPPEAGRGRNSVGGRSQLDGPTPLKGAGAGSQPPHTRPQPTGSTGADTQASCRRIRRHLQRPGPAGRERGFLEGQPGPTMESAADTPSAADRIRRGLCQPPRRIRRPPPPQRRKSLPGIAKRNKITIFALAER